MFPMGFFGGILPMTRLQRKTVFSNLKPAGLRYPEVVTLLGPEMREDQMYG